MDKIKAILIDDELNNRQLLRQLLLKHCPQIVILGEAESAEEAYTLVMAQQPDLVFLDIKMPGKSGFQFLRMFQDISFMIIFVTGYDEFALSAFEFNALDYLLKPIDYHKLQTAVDRVSKLHSLRLSSQLYKQMQKVDEADEIKPFKKIAVHTADTVVFIDLSDIKYFEAASSYCSLILKDNKSVMTSKLLGDYEILLAQYPQFVRISKQHMINLEFIKSYSKGNICEITLLDTIQVFETSRRRKSEVLEKLKVIKLK
jgi:two-component system, LytTR family, response regulator